MTVLAKSRSRARIATYFMASLVLVTSMAMAVPKGVSANVGPCIVIGYVTDSAGHPLAGASVVVVIKNGTQTVDTQSGTTQSDGAYSITVATDVWKVGYDITATATYNSAQASNSTVCTGGINTINIQYPYEIPQFGSILGFLVAGALIAFVAIVFLMRKSL